MPTPHVPKLLLNALLSTSLTLAVASGAQASANLQGTYSGIASDVATGCANMMDDGPSGPTLVTMTFNTSAGSFTGTGTSQEEDGNDSFTISGTVNDLGIVTGSGMDAIGSFTFNGALVGNTLTIAYIGMDSAPPIGDGCTYTGGAVLEGGVGDVVPALAAGSALTSAFSALQSTQQTVSQLTTRTGNMLRLQGSGGGAGATGVREISDGMQFETGLAAGDNYQYPVGVWASYTRTESDNGFVSTAFDSSSDNFMGGIDIRPWDDAVLGLAVGYQNSDVDTRFNRGAQDIDGITIAPYFGWLFGDLAGFSLSVDLTGGKTNVDIDQYRTAPTSGNRVSSSVDADRWFWAGNLTASRMFDQWYLSGHFGILWTEEEQESFTESDGTINPNRITGQNQWSLGAEAAYSMGAFEPYGSVIYEKDYSVQQVGVAANLPQPSNDRDDYRLGLGLRYYGDSGISGAIEWNTILDRDNYDEDNVSLLIRADF